MYVAEWIELQIGFAPKAINHNALLCMNSKQRNQLNFCDNLQNLQRQWAYFRACYLNLARKSRCSHYHCNSLCKLQVAIWFLRIFSFYININAVDVFHGAHLFKSQPTNNFKRDELKKKNDIKAISFPYEFISYHSRFKFWIQIIWNLEFKISQTQNRLCEIITRPKKFIVKWTTPKQVA